MKYERKGSGKPSLNSLDEIKEQIQELEHDNNHPETDSYIRFQERDELSDYPVLVEESIVEVKAVGEEYSEIMRGVEYPETKYLFSPSALKEISKLVGEPDYNSKSLESLTKQALYKEIVYLKKGGFKEKVVLDYYMGYVAGDSDADGLTDDMKSNSGIGSFDSNFDGKEIESRTDLPNSNYHLGNELTEIEPITCVLASHEDLERLVDTRGFLELCISFPLPGDTLSVGDLDLATQKKINNFEYGGTTHDFFEPTNHEWENEHAKE